MLTLDIENVQHITTAKLELDLGRHGIVCLVGRNGVGKTTLIKALSNLRQADTFKRTAVDGIFSETSKILYRYGEIAYEFLYDKRLGSLNCRTSVASSVKEGIEVELPMPHGERFNFFQSISDADHAIRSKIVLEDYTTPDELIGFLREIYGVDKFEKLRQIDVKGKSYFCLVLDDSRYIREDYFSSGEYFLICLYRKIRARSKLIVIDEIDISLDAVAQSRLAASLRAFCDRYEVNILFTTHSLAMIRTLEAGELFYIDYNEGVIDIRPRPYSYIKSVLFGFVGWDRYILVEDDILCEFVEFAIRRYLSNVFYSHKVIYVGGGRNTIDLMNRNAGEGFLAPAASVMAILDGDQRDERYLRHAKGLVSLIPWLSIEKEVYRRYFELREFPRLPEGEYAGIEKQDGKALFKAMQREKVLSREDIFSHLCDTTEAEVREFVRVLENFLCN